jgi:hypothetical protein
VIVDQDGFTPQLSRKAFDVMKQITVNYDHFEMIHAVNKPIIQAMLVNVKEYPEVFDGHLGDLPGGDVPLTHEADC